MAKRVSKVRKDSRVKNISSRKRNSRAQSRMEFTRLGRLIRNTVQSDAGHLDSLQRDEETSGIGKNGDISNSKGMDREEERKRRLLNEEYPGIVTGHGPFNPSIDPLKFLEEDRGKIYGDPFLSHQAIGLAWEGVFRNRYHGFTFEANPVAIGDRDFGIGKVFPASLVAEMLAAFKIVRLARPVYHKDSGDDAKVYVDFSQRFRESK
jgi:Domain of unknown function (DUF6378)